MDSKVTPRYGAGSYVLWQDRLYRVLYTIDGDDSMPLLALQYVDTLPSKLRDEDEYESLQRTCHMQQGRWH
jgi:hypothetical protein